MATFWLGQLSRCCHGMEPDAPAPDGEVCRRRRATGNTLHHPARPGREVPVTRPRLGLFIAIVAQQVEQRSFKPWVGGSSPPDCKYGVVAQSAEARDLKSLQYGFESHRRYTERTVLNVDSA